MYIGFKYIILVIYSFKWYINEREREGERERERNCYKDIVNSK